jgi:predicted permease
MLDRLSSLWRNLRHRDRVDRELDDEVRAVFDILVDEKMKAGMTRNQARRAATLELGRVDALTQQVREERTGAWLDGLIRDARYGARLLRANPGFTAVVVLSLAIGIGANSALFSVANALLLQSLPIPDPGTLHTARFEAPVPVPQQISYPFFEEARAATPGRVAAISRIMRVQSRAGADTSMVNMQLVSGEFFDALQLRPAVGRLFTADDNRTVGAHPVAVIANDFWHRRFNGDPDIVGRELTLNGVRLTIVGVAPPRFRGVWLETPVDAWVPIAMQGDVRYFGNFSASNPNLDQPWMPQDGIRWLELLVRADRTDGRESAALNATLRPHVLRGADESSDPESRRALLQQKIVLEPFGRGASAVRDRFRAPLFFLITMVAVLLIVACVNTANLMLARAASRQREMAVRFALGAARRRVISQLLVESLLISALAAAVGLAIAPFAGNLLVRMTMGVDTGPLPFAVPIDGRVLLFTSLLALATAVLSGLAPALRAADPALAATLKDNARALRSGAKMNLQKGLVIAQVALSLVLVTSSALFLRSVNNLAMVPLGFDAGLVVSASINPRIGGYGPDDLEGMYGRVLDRVRALPGVEAAAIGTCGLMSGCRSSAHGIVIEGYAAQPGEDVSVQENHVSPDYLRAAGISLVRGRQFTPRDAGAPVAIINESFARRYFASRDPIGQRIGRDVLDTEIIGVARDARVNSVREEVAPMLLFPFTRPAPFVGSLLVRTTGDPATLVSTMRQAVVEVEPNLPIDRVTTVASLASATYRQERVVARLTTALGLIALGLACLGLYGLMSYAVKQRTAELAIRFALGAPRPRVLWMVFRESLALMLVGLAIGIPIIMVASRLVSALLFEVDGSDPIILGGAMSVLLIVGATSSYLPSLRASRIDPLSALRGD